MLRPFPLRRAAAWLAFGLAAPLVCAAADLNVTLPNVSGPPGTQVTIPITVSPAPAGLGILSIDMRLAFNPAVVAYSSSQADGFLQFWGPPFVSGTSSFLAAATTGPDAISSSSTLLNTVKVVIAPKAAWGTVMPLTFHHLIFNDGTPTVAVTNGSITVTQPPADVSPAAANALAFALAGESPARHEARFRLALPAGGAPARVAIYALDGRRVRTLEAGAKPGTRELAWDLRTEAGGRAPSGVYFARAQSGAEARIARFVVLD